MSKANVVVVQQVPKHAEVGAVQAITIAVLVPVSIFNTLTNTAENAVTSAVPAHNVMQENASISFQMRTTVESKVTSVAKMKNAVLVSAKKS